MKRLEKKIALEIIPYLKSESEILEVMEKTGYDWRVCEAGIKSLKKLSSK